MESSIHHYATVARTLFWTVVLALATAALFA